MNHRIPWMLLLLSLGASFCIDAQDRRERQPARVTGKLVGIAGGVLQVESDKGERWLVAVEARPQDISFQATASPSFVQPGMLVQFRVPLDKKGEAQEELTQLKVISQRMGTQIGAVPDGGFAGGELFASDDDGGKKKKKVRGDTTPYLVTGTVRSIKDGKMYVAAGGATIKAEVADNCQVSVDIADVRFAREGDSVEVNDGWRYANQSNQLYARRLTIITDKPLGVEEKKRRPTTKAEDKKSEEKKKEKDSAAPAESKDKPKDGDKSKDSDKSKDGEKGDS